MQSDPEKEFWRVKLHNRKQKNKSVMFKNVCKTVIGILYGVLIYSNANSQDILSWQMQPIQIQTRWAKDVSPSTALSEYPRPQMVRKDSWQNLNGLWEYAITDKEATKPDNFDGAILVPFPIESALSGVKKKLLPSQLLWYKRSFVKPLINTTEKVLLHFGAVDWQTSVFLNDIEVGKHTGGYTSFSIDITNALKTGNNELIVKVFDPTDKGIGPHGKQILNPGNIYYTASSGIWQTVWLETVPAVHITDLKFTPDIDNGKLDLRVNLSPVIPANSTSISKNSPVIPAKVGISSTYSIEAIILSEGKEILKQVQGDLIGAQHMVLKVPNTRLWSPNYPFLYDLVIRLKKNGKVVDEVKSYFGMRKVNIQKDEKGTERIFLNNKPYFNLGILDQGFWPDGLYTAPTDEALKFDIKVIKAMGFNTIRKHIKVEPARWYYHADKLGVLVWQDFVNPNQGLPEGAKVEFEKGLKETMEQLYNYPSIVSWVIFNERWGQYDQQRITETVKQRDPSRIINGHSGELLYVNNILRIPSNNPYSASDIADIHSYPFPRNVPHFSGKAQVLGEFGGIGVPVEGHLWDDLVTGWGYDGIGTPLTLRKKYTSMIDTLIELKNTGLSGAIYTQPFDVESEQNGLITYDRSVVKLPFPLLAKLNGRIFKSNNRNTSVEVNNLACVADSQVMDYDKRVEIYNSGRRDSAFLRTLSLLALERRDTFKAIELANNYIIGLKNHFSIINLKYIRKMTFSINNVGFNILFNNRNLIDSLLGPNVVEMTVMKLIDKDIIQKHLNKPDINWSKIEDEVLPKYGELGEEKIWACKLSFYWEKQDWANYGIYYKLYFDKVLPLGRNIFHINNMSWSVFENVSDLNVLHTAMKTMQYDLEKFEANNPFAIDTYANLLYKLGNKQQALIWELKALKLSNNDEDIRKVYNKMKNNEKTWKY